MQSSATQQAKHSESSKAPIIDLSILKSEDNDCFGDNAAKVDINQCASLQRILCALKYYTILKLNVKSTTNTKDLFIDFCDNAYPHLLTDYQHVISTHEPHLEEINDQLMNDDKYDNCTASQCALSRRYNSNTIRSSRNRDEAKQDDGKLATKIDPKLIFYQELLDGVHHWLWHLYDIGMRIKRDVITGDDQNPTDTEEKEDQETNIDHAFGRIANYVRDKRDKARSTSDRFSNDDTNNKFKLNIAEKGSISDQDDNKSTIIDAIFTTLAKAGVTDETLAKFAAFVKEESFDTDSINDDIMGESKGQSNIKNHVDNTKFSRHITDYIDDKNVSMFSQGFTWFYWQYYRDGGKRIQIPGNENDFQGHSEKDLCVPCKYQSYKEEILAHLDKEFYDLVMVKAKQYLNTYLVKQMKPHFVGHEIWKYDISKDNAPDINHLMALILYCDYTAYCTEFSSTFRKISWNESIQDVKKRNSFFWYQSKYFREIIECYGTCNYDNEYVLPPGAETEAGPFFTGIDMVLAIPQFSLRLCSPTSTSKHLSVSLNFSKRGGMIITLDNPDSDLRSSAVAFLDVSWLSRFPDEDERVFAGGAFPIKVKSVRIIETSRNYQNTFAALHCLDTMLSDGRLELDSKVPLKLIKQLMDIDESLLSFDSYIISMVKAYIRHKRQIVLNMHGLELEVLQGFVTDGEFKRTKTTQDDWRPESLSSSRLNLISPDLISKFPNATTIVIKTSDGAGDFIYPFDMFYFLTSIQQALNWKLIKIEQFVRNKKNFGKSWIAKLWRSSKDKLMNDYKEQLKISFHEQEIKTGDGFDQSVEYFRIIRE